METIIYNQDGKKAGTIELSKDIFGLNWNADLVNQVVNSMRSDARHPIAHTKIRSEVSGGGKKPWQQKGLGRSRHGSSRSPIWVKGGVALGPRNDKNYGRKINKQMKAKALFTMLSQKMRDGEIIFVNDLAVPSAKTKDALTVVKSLAKVPAFEKLATKRTNTLYIALPEKNEAVYKGFKNFSNMTVEEVRNLNPLSLLKYKYLLISNPEKALSFFNNK